MQLYSVLKNIHIHPLLHGIFRIFAEIKTISMILYNPKDHSYQRIDLDLNMKIYNELLAQTDSQPKNPPFRKLSKKQFYELVKKEPWHLFSNVYDDVEDRNDGKVIWMPLCKEPLRLEEIMELRKQYKKSPN